MIDFEAEARRIIRIMREPNKLVTEENETIYLARCLEIMALRFNEEVMSEVKKQLLRKYEKTGGD